MREIYFGVRRLQNYAVIHSLKPAEREEYFVIWAISLLLTGPAAHPDHQHRDKSSLAKFKTRVILNDFTTKWPRKKFEACRIDYDKTSLGDPNDYEWGVENKDFGFGIKNAKNWSQCLGKVTNHLFKLWSGHVKPGLDVKTLWNQTQQRNLDVPGWWWAGVVFERCDRCGFQYVKVAGRSCLGFIAVRGQGFIYPWQVTKDRI